MFLRSGRVYGYNSENEKGVWKPYFDNDNDNNNSNNNNNNNKVFPLTRLP